MTFKKADMACCRSRVGKKGLIGVGEALEKVSILHGIMRPSRRKMWNEEALTLMYQALRAFAIITRTTKFSEYSSAEQLGRKGGMSKIHFSHESYECS